jgi:hypothetical protein
MIWLGLLLLAIVLLEALGRQRAFALATLIAVVGFSATLAVINVDTFIVDRNIDLIQDGQELNSTVGRLVGDLDSAYLGTLSDDSAPALVSAYRRAVAKGDDQLSQQLATAITCHFTVINEQRTFPWQSWNLSQQTGLNLWNELIADPDFPTIETTDQNTFFVDDTEYSCYGLFLD